MFLREGRGVKGGAGAGGGVLAGPAGLALPRDRRVMAAAGQALRYRPSCPTGAVYSISQS